MIRSAHNARSRISGFSLVEMMVAMVIALIALGAVGAMYLSSSQAARFHTAVQRIQENGRFATDMLSRTIRMGGYDDPLDVVALPGVWLKGTINSTGVIFTPTGVTLKSTADTVGVAYQGGSGIRDCQGRSVAGNGSATNLYAVSTNNQLVCASQHSNGLSYAAIPLAEGVEDMLVLYGIDLDGDRVANRFIAANSVTDWTQVVSLRVALLINSVTPALGADALMCMGCIAFTGASDRLVRAEFETTIGLRNQAGS